jgi:hypothetical protein
MRLLSEVLIFLSFMSMSVLLFFFYLYKRRYHDQVGKITSELKNYVSDFHGNLGQIESNFLRFFEKMNLNDQKVAFDQYQQYWRSYYFEQLKNDQQFENQSLKNDYMTADEMSTVQDLIKDKDVESIISQEKEKINATGSINEIDFGDIKKVDFEDQTFDIIKFDIWAKKFLASPVIMELKERIAITNSLSKNKNILINIEEDGLNLIIYHVFLKIAEKYQQMDLEKDQSKVEVKSSFSKNILKLSFKIDNLIFNPDELEYFSENKNQDNLDLNFEVISDFLQKFGLMINLKNKINSQEQNCEINISFPCMKTPRSLSHLVKGKKKHIIQEMKKQSEQRL